MTNENKEGGPQMPDGYCFSVRRMDHDVARLTIEAGPMNILGTAEIDVLDQALISLAAESTLKCLVIEGSGRAFIGGANIKEMQDFDAHDAGIFIKKLHGLCERVRQFPAPVIAQIDGWCLGGGLEFATACDIRIASTKAKFAMPEVKLGIPSVIHAALLPRFIGSGRARWWLLTGETIDADTARSWGLIDFMVSAEQLNDQVARTTASIAECGSQAIRAQKTLLNEWEELTPSQATRSSIDAFTDAFRGDEPKAAMAEFLSRKR